jgi:integrase
MAVGKVNISSIAKLNGWLWDTQCVGFGARRQTNGCFYYVRYRHNGTQIVKSIGRHGSPWTPDTARNEARRLLGIVAGGFDPHAKLLAGEGFATAVDRYLERKRASLRPNSFRGAEHYLRNHSAPLRKLRLDEIDRRKVATLLGQIETASGPIARNRLRSTLSAFFAWAIQEGLVETNPVAGTGKADEGNSRERVLTHDELRKLWRSLGDGSFADIVRLLLLTGQRRNEIGGLQWSEVDLARKLIALAPDRTKNGRQHEVPLSAQALAIIEGLPRRNSTDYLFGKRSAYSDWGRAKQELDERLRITPWRIHDLRRTAATGMAELAVQPNVIELALNHQSGHKAGIAGVYNRSKLTDAVREGLQRWADYVEKITT